MIHLALIAWVGWIAAGLVDRWVAGSLQGAGSYTAHTRSIAANSNLRPFKPNRDYYAIVRSNIFNSTQANQGTDIRTDNHSGVSKSELPADAQKTSLDLRLIGTVLSKTGDYRLAAIEIKDLSEQRLYKINDTVSGASIFRIERNRVGLMNNGNVEVLEIEFAEDSFDDTPATPVSPTLSSFPGRDVIKSGEGDYKVSRRYVDSQLKNMSSLLTQARAVPNIDSSGATNGFRLFSIKQGSLFSKIGLQNHDVVQRINGVELNSAEKALDLFQALRNESSFKVDLLRRAKKTTLRLNVQ